MKNTGQCKPPVTLALYQLCSRHSLDDPIPGGIPMGEETKKLRALEQI
jgi:hypothetical protein